MTSSRSGQGLRERKKLRTREAIRAAAFDLFERQGFARTTVDQIVSHAEVSPATFFRHFPTKEAVVVTDEYDHLFEPAVHEGPEGERPMAMLRRTFKQVLGTMASDAYQERLVRRLELIRQEPTLRAAMVMKQEEGVKGMIAGLAEATGRSPDDLVVRMAARLVLTAVTETVDLWLERGGRDSLPDLLDETFDLLAEGLPL